MPFSRHQRQYTFNGIFLVAMTALAALYLSEMPLFSALKLSPLMWGILIGIMYGNTLKGSMPDKWTMGVTFCSKRLLRIAVGFYGFRITFQEIADVGVVGFFASVFMLVSTLGIGYFLGVVCFRLDRATSFLTAIGAAVCGAAAVLAAESVIRAKASQASVALLTVVLFGTLAMFVYPALYQAGFIPLSPTDYGIYTGASVHEVAHVVAAGNAVGPEAGSVAVIVKMTRVLMLAPLLLLLGLLMTRTVKSFAGETHYKIPIPWFALGFILCAVINSLPILPPNVVGWIVNIDTFLLTMAMTALGMETSLKQIQNIGAKPFYLGGCLMIWLMLGGFGVVSALNVWI